MRINYASQIVDALSMRDVAEYYGLNFNRLGFAVCPFHSEDTASFKVYDSNKKWHCFGCGKDGDVIDFVRMYLNLSFPEACEQLNNDFGLRLPIGKQLDYRTQKAARSTLRAREKQLMLERAERDEIYGAYSHALDIWCACDYLLIHAPVMSYSWALAARYRDEAAYELDDAEGRLLAYEQTRHADHNTGMGAGRIQHGKTV